MGLQYGDLPHGDTIVLVPLRSFDDAKSRLADLLDSSQRQMLMRFMTEKVLRARPRFASLVSDQQ